MTQTIDVDAFDGPREFTYIKAANRRLSEYEALNLFVQPIDGHVAGNVAKRSGWPAESTELRSADWYAFRDPAQMWQRPYTKRQAEQERTLERATAALRSGGALHRISGEWAAGILGDLYVPWAYFEHGLFRALSHCSVVALSDVLSVAFVFNAFDKERHAQDILFHQYDLVAAEVPVGHDDRRDLWLHESSIQPARALVEHVNAISDWGEGAVAINLVVEPLLGRFVCNEVLWAGSALHGDFLTPVVLAEAENDRQRNQTWTVAMVGMLLAEPMHADHNREVINRWLGRWYPEVAAVMEALTPFAQCAGVDSISAEKAVGLSWRDLIAACGLSAPEGAI